MCWFRKSLLLIYLAFYIPSGDVVIVFRVEKDPADIGDISIYY